jgi:hypothetical protein
LKIVEPANSVIINDFVIDVIGETEVGAEVKINGKMIFLNKDGYFRETISLQKGLNLIKITAKKKYSEEKIIYRQIMVDK